MQEIALSPLIDLKNATKIYPTGMGDYHALKGVDVSIDRGELVAIIGASGSGKSTLMNILGFLDQCTTGEYYFAGQLISRLNDHELALIRNQKVGFVFQAFFLLPRLTALQNVMLPLFYREEIKSIAIEKALTMLDRVGMKSLAHHKPNQLSGGQQQRVAIARALVGDPEIIFADEPTGSLDSKTGKEVMDLFLELNQAEKRTLVLVTHDVGVSRQCRRVISIKDGVIV